MTSTQLLGERQEQVADPAGVGEVEQGRRLVGDDHVGLDREDAGEGEQLALAARERVDAAVAETLEPVCRQQRLRGGSAEPLVAVVAPQGQGDVLGGGRHDQLGGGVGEHEADLAAYLATLARDVEAVDSSPSPWWP